jgi:uncharacterized protein (DUF2267 family)
VNRKFFLEQIASRVNCNEERAEAISLAVFYGLREQITHREALEVALQLPAGLRGPWLEARQYCPTAIGTVSRRFIVQVRELATLSDDTEAKRAIFAVCAVLEEALTEENASEPDPKEAMASHDNSYANR